jgi:transposase
MARVMAELVLSETERAELKQLSSRRKTAQALALRARIVLECAQGLENQEVAAGLGVAKNTVGKWRRRFVERRMDGLHDEPRSGAPRSIEDAGIEAVIVKTLESVPENATHWSSRGMAKASGISVSSVQRIWRAFGLQPHRIETFKLSTDPDFVAKVRDVVGLYVAPPEHAVVFCVDEKSQIQALDRTQPGLPMKKGRAGTMTHDYKRNGTATLFAALDAMEGSVISMCEDRHRHQEWLKFLRVIDYVIPAEKQIHMIVDNYATHKHPKVQRWLKRHRRFQIHFTPTGCSWLNMVERFFRDLTQNRLRRGIFRNVEELMTAIGDYADHHNKNPKPFIWTAKASDILEKVKRARYVLNMGPSA